MQNLLLLVAMDFEVQLLSWDESPRFRAEGNKGEASGLPLGRDVLRGRSGVLLERHALSGCKGFNMQIGVKCPAAGPLRGDSQAESGLASGVELWAWWVGGQALHIPLPTEVLPSDSFWVYN